MSHFHKEGERYELEISTKHAAVPTLKTLPYSASVDRSLLKSLFYVWKFDEICPKTAAVKDLTDDDIEK